jgi:predicted amidophosphoribosyltransferase
VTDRQSVPPSPASAVTTRILLGTFAAGHADPLHLLIRAARAGDRVAVSEVIDRVRVVAWAAWPGIQSAVVVAVPGHRAGPANRLNLEVASELGLIRRWNHAPGALRRWRRAPEAKFGGARDAMAEATTMEWVSADGGEAIILVDDVIRTGLTLQACAATVRASGDRRRIVGLAVAARASE